MSGFFSDGTLDQIRAASDIVDVIGSILPLKRAGSHFVALCPFHKEKTPSFHVNPQRQIFHCFGCHKGGDVFAFIKDYENVTFPEAVRFLADRAKIPLVTERGASGPAESNLKEKLLDLHEQVTRRWQENLLHASDAHIAREYLEKRGVSLEAIRLFRLGHAPESWDATLQWGQKKGYEPALLEKAGLIIKKEEGGFYDRFRGRLMFPICDEQGRVIGFSGRILQGDEKTAKYVNSPETPLFTKSKVIYGLDKSKKAILEEQLAIICEGQLDLIACYMAGVKNVVAPQGTALTSEHTRILKRFVNQVVLCFDSDLAGQKAAVRSLDDLLASGLVVRVARLPAPHDPDSFIRQQGGGAFQQLIAKAEPFFDFYLQLLCETNDPTSDAGQQIITRSMADAVAKTGDRFLIDKYARATAARMGVSIANALAYFIKASKSAGRGPKAAEPETAPASAAVPAEAVNPLELWLLRLMFLEDDCAAWVQDRLRIEWVQHPLVRRIVDRKLHLPREQWTGVASLLAELEPAAAELLTSSLCDPRSIPNPMEILKGTSTQLGLLERMRDRYIDGRIKELKQQMHRPGIAEVDQTDLMREAQALKEMRGRPLDR